MKARVRKWGRSLAVRIPKPVAERIGLRPAGEVELLLENGVLRLVPAGPRWELRHLLSRVTKRNLHAEAGVGTAVGREAW